MNQVILDSELPETLRDEIIARGRKRSIRRGQVVIDAGANDREVYLLIEGSVEVSLVSARGQNMIIRQIGIGALFGEFAALDGRPRSAAAIAREDSRLIEISGDAFLDILRETPGAGLWLARQLAEEVRRLTQRHFEMSTMAVTARIQCELLHLANTAGIRDDSVLLDPAPTHAAIAARIGSHREAVTREFGNLSKLGIIAQNKRELMIMSVSRLVSEIQRASGEDFSSEEWMVS